MRRLFNTAIGLLLCLGQAAIFAGEPHYAAVIDGGSTGSRVHLYQYQTDQALPSITEVFYASVKPGLSSYSEHPQEAGKSLEPLLDAVAQYLQRHGIAEHEITIRVLGTGGMRMLSEDIQSAVYASVNTYIQHHYPFIVQEVATISGKVEGLYGWLDINYLAGRLGDDAETLGSIDVGGASIELVYETDVLRDPENEVRLSINGRHRIVHSKSFSGLGLEELRNELNQKKDALSCYPDHYPVSSTLLGQFNLPSCEIAYENLLQNHKVEQFVTDMASRHFIAYSGAYSTLAFLGVADDVEKLKIEDRLQAICSQSWEVLKQSYPDIPEKYLSGYCANGVYIDDLLFGEYQLRDRQVTVASNINHQPIDWALGALLYALLMHP